jgi:hypothetical protein
MGLGDIAGVLFTIQVANTGLCLRRKVQHLWIPDNFKWQLRASTQYALFGCSLVFSSFHVSVSCRVWVKNKKNIILEWLTTNKKCKHQNAKLRQKVHSVYSPLPILKSS